jgi:hypothetical protein
MKILLELLAGFMTLETQRQWPPRPNRERRDHSTAWQVELFEPGAATPQFMDAFGTFDALSICIDQLAWAHARTEYLLHFTVPGSASAEQMDLLRRLGAVNGEPLDSE